MRNSLKINIKLFGAQIVITFVVYALPLFIPAGIKLWLAGWIFIVLWFGFWCFVLIWLSRHNLGLLQERMKVSSKDQKIWDRVLGLLLYSSIFVWLLFISFDVVRIHLSMVPFWLQIIGLIILLGSFYLFFVTFRENSYLSPLVRIQEDREQRVISTGPYHYVRHPMYSATVVFIVGTPLLLGSLYGVPLGLIIILILAWRAVLEEWTLRKELTGYED